MTGSTPPVADRVRDAVLAVDGVAGLHAGTFGDVATYLPGHRVSGVRIGRDGVAVHVIVHLDTDIAEVARTVHAAAVAQLERTVPCTVVVEDVVAGSAGRATERDVGAPETRKS